MNNMIIKFLKIYGKDKEPATLELCKGMNVITGSSNTGKSYAFQALLYLLGKSSPPKSIKQSKGYTFGRLELHFPNDLILTIERSLKPSNDARLYFNSITDIESNTNPKYTDIKTGTTTKGNISEQILGILDLYGKEIINKVTKGEKGKVHLSDYRRLLFTDETSIIKEESPFLSGSFDKITREKSIFNYLITAYDYGDLLLKDFPKAQAGLKSKIEYLKNSIEEDTRKIERLKGKLEGQNIDFDLFDKEMNELNNSLSLHQKNFSSTLKKYNKVRQSLQNFKSKLDLTGELEKRFDLLKAQYTVDIERMEHIVNVDQILNDLETTFCPHCNQEIKNSDHDNCDITPEMQSAFEQEVNKTKKLLSDLELAISDVQKERSELSQKISTLDGERLTYKAQIDAIKKDLDKLEKLISKKKNIKEDFDLIKYFEQKSKEQNEKMKILKKKLKDSKDTSKEIKAKEVLELDKKGTRAFEKLCTKYLKKINLYDDNTVKFDEEKMDIVIGEEERKTSGKGFRSITHSTMKLSLAKLASKLNTIPDLLVLDSPLTSYEGERKIEEDEVKISQTHQNAFFELFKESADDIQIIIFDNKKPAKSILKDIHLNEFTKDEASGRYGFFPIDYSQMEF